MDFRAELEAAQEAARRGGEILRRYQESGARYGWKQSNDRQHWSGRGFGYEVVSEADVEGR